MTKNIHKKRFKKSTLSKEKSNKRVIDWISSFSQFALVIIAIITVKLTVIPIYQKEILQEKIIVKEKELEIISNEMHSQKSELSLLYNDVELMKFISFLSTEAAQINDRTDISIYLNQDQIIEENSLLNPPRYIQFKKNAYFIENNLTNEQEEIINQYCSQLEIKLNLQSKFKDLRQLKDEYQFKKMAMKNTRDDELNRIENDRDNYKIVITDENKDKLLDLLFDIESDYLSRKYVINKLDLEEEYRDKIRLIISSVTPFHKIILENIE